MAQPVQLRRGTVAERAASNTVLAQGEPALVIDPATGKVIDLLFGDGQTAAKAVESIFASLKSAKLLAVGDNGWAMAAFGKPQPQSTPGTSGYGYTIGAPVSGLRLRYVHHLVDTGIIDGDGTGGTITFNVSIKVVSSSNPSITAGTIIPLTFNGKKSITLDPGGSIELQTVGLNLFPGDVVTVLTYLASGTAYTLRPTNANRLAYTGFTANQDLTAVGSAAPATGGAVAGLYFGPASLLGYTDPTAKPIALGLLGDSAAFSGGDPLGAPISMPQLGNGGFGNRAMTGIGGFINFSYSGDGLANFLTSAAGTRKTLSLLFCNMVHNEYGANDLSGGVTPAVFQANLLRAAALVRNYGITKYTVQTLIPRTTSTDNWATLANQTVSSWEAARVTHNTWVRDNCPIDPTTKAPVAAGTAGALRSGQYGHPITGWLEMADICESSRNSGLWKTPTRVQHYNVASGSNIITLTDGTFNTANLEAGGDNGACGTFLGIGASGAAASSGIAVQSTTTAALSILASQAVAGGTLLINPATVDGAHPDPLQYIAMGQLLRSVVQAAA